MFLEKYGVSNEYDYIKNSIYKTFLACDSVSDEILLSYHYRVKKRDNQKNEICRQQGFELIRVENSYARRYNYIKNILIDFFSKNKI